MHEPRALVRPVWSKTGVGEGRPSAGETMVTDRGGRQGRGSPKD